MTEARSKGLAQATLLREHAPRPGHGPGFVGKSLRASPRGRVQPALPGKPPLRRGRVRLAGPSQADPVAFALERVCRKQEAPGPAAACPQRPIHCHPRRPKPGRGLQEEVLVSFFLSRMPKRGEREARGAGGEAPLREGDQRVGGPHFQEGSLRPPEERR